MEDPKILIGLDLSVASMAVIEVLIEDAAEPALFDEIVQANQGRQEILELLLNHPDTPEQVKNHILGILQLPVKPQTNVVAAATDEHRQKQAKPQKLLQRIQTLSVGERLQLALKGGREIRSILVKDSNKQVMLSVLDNQKITDSEIELIAKSRQVPEEALRIISKNREWLKNYAITFALATNPKTPPGISVTLISSLKVKDLVLLDKNRNVPELVRTAAKRLLAVRKPK
jgi:hypothetical protein